MQTPSTPYQESKPKTEEHCFTEKGATYGQLKYDANVKRQIKLMIEEGGKDPLMNGQQHEALE